MLPRHRCATTNSDQRFQIPKGWLVALRSHSNFDFSEVKGKRWPERKYGVRGACTGAVCWHTEARAWLWLQEVVRRRGGCWGCCHASRSC
ncbi:hypothetical protein V6Z11_A09G120000 [Gossypium hirsutum]